MKPRKMYQMRKEYNEQLFNIFLYFPKPILVAVNEPAIGASISSAALCDGIIASEKASFLTPFARLEIPAEGWSSINFDRMLGKAAAHKMLGEDWSCNGCGFSPTIPGGGNLAEYKEINATESSRIADAFLS